ncbi:MAG: hypothetical protein WCP79_15115 [Bacillota bacterium]
MRKFSKKLILIFGVAAVCVLCYASLADAASNYNNSKNPYAHWMSDNQSVLRGLAVNKAILISSHDSMSYGVQVGAVPCIGYRTHQQQSITVNCTPSRLFECPVSS